MWRAHRNKSYRYLPFSSPRLSFVIIHVTSTKTLLSHAQEPLHFNVCAESEEILARAVAKVQELVSKAKMELERF